LTRNELRSRMEVGRGATYSNKYEKCMSTRGGVVRIAATVRRLKRVNESKSCLERTSATRGVCQTTILGFIGGTVQEKKGTANGKTRKV